MRRREFLQLSAAACASLAGTGFGAAPRQRPNLVIIYADDLGYGDVSCYGANKIKTPNIDRLASRGRRFINAHAPAATCTPSRYSLLTGEYAWRKKGTGILPGDAALIIEPARTTLPSMLQRAGYTTGVVGKWHLGLGSGNLNWNEDIKPGALDIGFDYSFLIPATGDRAPCVFVENRRVVGLDPADPIEVSYRAPVGTEPTGRDHPELLKMRPSQGHDQTIVNGISRIGDWKYIEPNKGAKIDKGTNIELGNDPQPQLYDLRTDLAERQNLASRYPAKVEEMAAYLKQIRDQGRLPIRGRTEGSHLVPADTSKSSLEESL